MKKKEPELLFPKQPKRRKRMKLSEEDGLYVCLSNGTEGATYSEKRHTKNGV